MTIMSLITINRLTALVASYQYFNNNSDLKKGKLILRMHVFKLSALIM